MCDPPALPPAGWYPDPEHPGGPYRWWNGAAWDSPFAPTSGAPSGLPDVGDWLGRAFARMLRHWRALGFIALATSVPSAVLTSLSIRYLFRDVAVINDELIGWSSDRLWVVGAFWVIAAVAGATGAIATVWLLLRSIDADRGADPRHATSDVPIDTETELHATGRALGAALLALPRTIGWMLLLTVVVAAAVVVLALVVYVALPIGLLLALACLPLGVYLTIRFAFVLQALADGPGNPFRRSARVSAGRFWPTCGRLLLLGVIAYGFSIVANLAISLSSGAGFGGAFGDPDRFRVDGQPDTFDLAAVSPSVAGIVVTAIVSLLSGIFVSGLVTAGFGELYRTTNPAAGE